MLRKNLVYVVTGYIWHPSKIDLSEAKGEEGDPNGLIFQSTQKYSVSGYDDEGLQKSIDHYLSQEGHQGIVQALGSRVGHIMHETKAFINADGELCRIYKGDFFQVRVTGVALIGVEDKSSTPDYCIDTPTPFTGTNEVPLSSVRGFGPVLVTNTSDYKSSEEPDRIPLDIA